MQLRGLPLPLPSNSLDGDLLATGTEESRQWPATSCLTRSASIIGDLQTIHMQRCCRTRLCHQATATPSANEGVETAYFLRTLREGSTERRKRGGIALHEVVGEGVRACLEGDDGLIKV